MPEPPAFVKQAHASAPCYWYLEISITVPPPGPPWRLLVGWHAHTLAPTSRSPARAQEMAEAMELVSLRPSCAVLSAAVR
jgi:hypothetical protein